MAPALMRQKALSDAALTLARHSGQGTTERHLSQGSLLPGLSGEGGAGHVSGTTTLQHSTLRDAQTRCCPKEQLSHVAKVATA